MNGPTTAYGGATMIMVPVVEDEPSSDILYK
jgi:hypothetical protein